MNKILLKLILPMFLFLILKQVNFCEITAGAELNVRYNLGIFSARQGGDTIEDPLWIDSIPFSDSGTTEGYNDDYQETCPYPDGLSPDVVYAYLPDTNRNVDITLCGGSDFDTKLYIYENEYSPGDYFACTDDDCYSPYYPYPYVSKLEGMTLSGGNIYYIIVDGFGGDYGNYTIDIYIPGCCDVNMIPDDDPVIVDPGGRFGLTGYIGNPTPDPIITDVWGGVLYQGNFYRQFTFNNIPLDPGESLTAHTTQNVPNWAPLGTYGYIAYCGDRPNTKCDSASFPFTVTGARSGDATEWAIEGNFFGSELVPTELALDNAYPNPFNATTTISYQLPAASRVNLDIYNVLGQRVTTLVNGNIEAGYHSVNWDASNYSSGIYFYKLSVGNRVFTKRMTLLK